MSANDSFVKCKCGGTPLVMKMNKRLGGVMGYKYKVFCPNCQRYESHEHDTREEAIKAWNDNISLVGKKK